MYNYMYGYNYAIVRDPPTVRVRDRMVTYSVSANILVADTVV